MDYPLEPTEEQKAYAAGIREALNDRSGTTCVEAGRRGGIQRARNLSPERRREIARMGGKAKYLRRERR